MKFKEGDRVAVYNGRIRRIGIVRSGKEELYIIEYDHATYPFKAELHEKQLRRLVKKKKVIEDFKTSKGYVFRKTKSGWIDLATWLEWQNEFKININHYEAEAWAKEQNMRLPTIEEFKVAEKHGIRELPNMQWKGYWFWSLTPHPYYSDLALEFNGYSGNTGFFDNRKFSDYDIAARCVSSPGVKVD